MSNFEKARIRFLQAINMGGNDGARRKDLPLADRANDKVRQSCRRDGLCLFQDNGNGSRWHLTEAGREYLKHGQGQ